MNDNIVTDKLLHWLWLLFQIHIFCLADYVHNECIADFLLLLPTWLHGSILYCLPYWGGVDAILAISNTSYGHLLPGIIRGIRGGWKSQNVSHNHAVNILTHFCGTHAKRSGFTTAWLCF